MSALQFPTSQDFDAKVAENKAKKWADLEPGTMYAVREIKEVKTRYGKPVIGTLETQDGEQLQVWLPARLGDDLQSQELPVFVRHEGLKQSKKNSSRQYHAYTLIVVK